MKHEDLIHRLRSRAMIEAPPDNEPDTRAAFEDVPEITFEELAEIAALLNEAADALEGGDTLVSPAPEIRALMSTTLVDLEYQEARQWRDRFLLCDDETEIVPALHPQIVAYLVADAEQLRALVAELERSQVVAPPPPAVDLEAIKARLEHVTGGPWAVAPCSDTDEIRNVVAGYKTIPEGVQAHWIAELDAQIDFDSDIEGQLEELGANAEFIAHARTDIPSLIAEVESLRARLQALAPERKFATTKDGPCVGCLQTVCRCGKLVAPLPTQEPT